MSESPPWQCPGLWKYHWGRVDSPSVPGCRWGSPPVVSTAALDRWSPGTTDRSGPGMVETHICTLTPNSLQGLHIRFGNSQVTLFKCYSLHPLANAHSHKLCLHHINCFYKYSFLRVAKDVHVENKFIHSFNIFYETYIHPIQWHTSSHWDTIQGRTVIPVM